jgi:hypothetical protein
MAGLVPATHEHPCSSREYGFPRIDASISTNCAAANTPAAAQSEFSQVKMRLMAVEWCLRATASASASLLLAVMILMRGVMPLAITAPI